MERVRLAERNSRASPPEAAGLLRVPRRAAAASRPLRAAIPDAGLASPVELQSPLQSRFEKLKTILPKSVVSERFAVSVARSVNRAVETSAKAP